MFKFNSIFFFYFLGGLLALLLSYLFEGHDLLGRDAQALYIVDLSSIVLLLGGYWVYLYKLTSARLRALVWSLLLCLNVALYHLASYAHTPKYAVILIVLLAFIPLLQKPKS